MIKDSFFKIKPWDHQRIGVSRAVQDPDGFAFFFEVGTGKTMTCINTLRYKYMEASRLRKTLILGPLIVLENWKRELLVHSNIPEKSIHVLSGTSKARTQVLSKIGQDDAIVITNYECVSRVKGMFELLQEWGPEILVLDESHRCKNIQAKQTKAVIKLSDQSDKVYLLSGTPVLNSLMDIFPQMRILDKGKTFGTSFYAFRSKYFYDKNSGMARDRHFPNWVPREGAAEEINLKLKEKSMHVAKSECLDLPPLVRKKVYVEMSKEQGKSYKSMLKNFVAMFESEHPAGAKAAVAELAVTKALRLQQITSGFVGTEDMTGEKGIYKFKKNPRNDALKDLLVDLAPNHKVIVWAVFKENYKDIKEVCEGLKIKYVEVHGSISQSDKMDAVDSFNNSSDVRVFIGHPGSGGIGINLVSSDVAIFYSRNFSLEYDIQAEARNYRGGSEAHQRVTRIDLVTPGTIDEQVLDALASKKKIGYKVLKEFILPE